MCKWVNETYSGTDRYNPHCESVTIDAALRAAADEEQKSKPEQAKCTYKEKDMSGLIPAIVCIPVILAELLGWMYWRQRKMSQAMKLDFVNARDQSSHFV